MARDYLQDALSYFNITKHQWYGFRKFDDIGNRIPDDQRMKYEHLILNDDTATMPSEAEVNAKIQEIKDIETAEANARTSGINKLKGATYSALTDAEAKALFGE